MKRDTDSLAVGLTKSYLDVYLLVKSIFSKHPHVTPRNNVGNRLKGAS